MPHPDLTTSTDDWHSFYWDNQMPQTRNLVDPTTWKSMPPDYQTSDPEPSTTTNATTVVDLGISPKNADNPDKMQTRVDLKEITTLSMDAPTTKTTPTIKTYDNDRQTRMKLQKIPSLDPITRAMSPESKPWWSQ